MEYSLKHYHIYKYKFKWRSTNLNGELFRVNSLEVDSDQAELGGQTQPKKSGSKKEMKCDRPDRLMVTLEAVQSDIAVLKEAMASQNASE